MISKENVKKLKQTFKEFEKELEKDPEAEKVKRDTKMWVDDTGIIHIELSGDMDSMMKYSEIMMNYSEKNKDKIIPSLEIRTLTKLPPILKMPSLKYRKRMAESLKGSEMNIKFQKMALCEGGVIAKTVLSFILTALGMKNVKHFKTEEKALKWLKEE